MYSFVCLLLELGSSIICCVKSTFQVILQNISNVDNLAATEVRPLTAHPGVPRRTHVNESQSADRTRHFSNLSSLGSHGMVEAGTTTGGSTSPVNDNDGDTDDDVVVVVVDVVVVVVVVVVDDDDDGDGGGDGTGSTYLR